jgi:hypothetical protein
MKPLTLFKRWSDRNRRGRGLICHLYESEGSKQKQYYTKSGYAYFNLFSASPDWIVKGTTGHGIRSERGKTCQTPVFNCYQINEKFYHALELQAKEPRKKYEIGIILNKNEIRKDFGENNVRDVELWDHSRPRPPPDDCWPYDIASPRKKLWPFNLCDVVRIRTTNTSLYGLPLALVPWNTLMGLLVKADGYNEKALSKYLTRKKLDEIDAFEFFPVL